LRHRVALDGQRGGERGGPPLDHAPRLVCEQPSPVGRDRDREHFVARGVERLRDGDGGDARDIVLGRAPTEEQQHANAMRRTRRAHQTTWNTARIPRPMRNKPTRPYSSSVRPRIDSRYWNAKPTVMNTRNP